MFQLWYLNIISKMFSTIIYRYKKEQNIRDLCKLPISIGYPTNLFINVCSMNLAPVRFLLLKQFSELFRNRDTAFDHDISQV